MDGENRRLVCTTCFALLALGCSESSSSSDKPVGSTLTAEWALHFQGGGIPGGSGDRFAARPDGSVVFSAAAPGPWSLYSASGTSSGEVAGPAVVLAPDGTSSWTLAWGFRVAADAQGDLVLAGSFNDSIDLGGGVLDAFGVASDAVAAKFSGADGQHVWSRAWGGSGYERFEHVELDPNGDLIVAGEFSTSQSFGGPGLTGNADGSSAGVIAKYAGASGDHIWSRRLADTETSPVWDVALDANGDVFVLGFSGSEAVTAVVTIWKLSGATGADIWKRQVPDLVNPRAIAVSADALFVGGSVASKSGPVSWESVSLPDPNGGGAPFVAALDPASGAVRWARTLADEGSAEDVAVTSTGLFLLGNGYVTQASTGALLKNATLWSCSPADGRTFDDYVMQVPEGKADFGWLAIDVEGHVWAGATFDGTLETGFGAPLVSSGVDAIVMRFGG